MFENQQDEETICQVLKAYMEEWGTENVIVSLPSEWRQYGTEYVAGVRFEFQPSVQFLSEPNISRRFSDTIITNCRRHSYHLHAPRPPLA